MSQMEFFCGTFERYTGEVPEDEDDFCDANLVEVYGTYYRYEPIIDLDPHEFAEVLPQIEGPILICYWYNGGAGIAEVVEAAIKRYLDETS